MSALSNIFSRLSDALGGSSGYRMPLRERLRMVEERAKDGVQQWWGRQTADEPTRLRTMRRLWIGGTVAVLMLAGGAWWLWGPRMQPNYETAALDEVFDYTLLSDEFNALPIEERMKLLGQLVQRMKGMSAEDSMLLAAFASGIGGKMRKQLEENASKIAIDLWDKHAKEYDTVPPEEREKFLEDAFVDFSQTLEQLVGEQRDMSPEERVADAKKQAARDMEWAKKNPERMPSGRMMGTAFGLMNNNVGGHASPEQKVRGKQMMRDMVRHFRGQDVATGKPKAPGPP
ncbi:MAG TPA: hypothetical protein VD997_02650 [Phycisphaerales bacterium]|nr:hypothetical protein [Phycisphaerales bacterium]